MTDQWILPGVTDAILKVWRGEGSPPGVWPMFLYNADLGIMVNVLSEDHLIKQTIGARTIVLEGIDLKG